MARRTDGIAEAFFHLFPQDCDLRTVDIDFRHFICKITNDIVAHKVFLCLMGVGGFMIAGCTETVCALGVIDVSFEWVGVMWI